MVKQSKRMKALAEKAPGKQPLSLADAVALLKTFDNVKFDQTVEVVLRLGVDPKQADQIVRGSIVLPHGLGRTQRVVVFAKGDKIDEAREAGAD
jgi:large subunit ribosomal protein L1